MNAGHVSLQSMFEPKLFVADITLGLRSLPPLLLWNITLISLQMFVKFLHKFSAPGTIHRVRFLVSSLYVFVQICQAQTPILTMRTLMRMLVVGIMFYLDMSIHINIE